MPENASPVDLFSARPVLSVIVCTYNRAKLLALCLDSLCKQGLPTDLYEVIVVDNNCTDDTAAVIASFCAGSVRIRRVVEPRQGLSNARNCGWTHACGSFLIYNDDDTILPPEYLANMLQTLQTYQPDIMGGPIYPFYTDRKPRWFRDKYEIRQYAKESGFSQTCRISGGNFVIRRDLLKQLGMFSPDLGMIGNNIALGEDAKVLDTYRHTRPPEQQKVYYDMACSVRHHVPIWRMKIGYVMRRAFANGAMKVKLMATQDSLTLRHVLRLTGYRLMRNIANVRHTVQHKGFRRLDPIAAFRSLSFAAGFLVQGLTLVLGKKAAPIA